jgi:hypothetical protein
MPRRANPREGTILLGFGAFLQELQNTRRLFAGGFALVLSPTYKRLLRNPYGLGYFGGLLEDNVPVVPK